MESIKDLHDFLEAELIRKKHNGTKAGKIRTFVYNLAGFVGKNRIAVDVAWQLANERKITDTPIRKGYFCTVINDEWHVETDADGIKWILVDQPM